MTAIIVAFLGQAPALIQELRREPAPPITTVAPASAPDRRTPDTDPDTSEASPGEIEPDERRSEPEPSVADDPDDTPEDATDETSGPEGLSNEDRQQDDQMSDDRPDDNQINDDQRDDGVSSRDDEPADAGARDSDRADPLRKFLPWVLAETDRLLDGFTGSSPGDVASVDRGADEDLDACSAVCSPAAGTVGSGE